MHQRDIGPQGGVACCMTAHCVTGQRALNVLSSAIMYSVIMYTVGVCRFRRVLDGVLGPNYVKTTVFSYIRQQHGARATTVQPTCNSHSARATDMQLMGCTCNPHATTPLHAQPTCNRNSSDMHATAIPNCKWLHVQPTWLHM